MKKTNWVALVLTAAVLGFAGCKKSEKIPESQQVNGVSVDMPKLQQAFADTTNDAVRRLVTEAGFGLRYGDYVKSMMALDQLAANPDVTEAQKKIVNDVIEQEKKLAGGAPAPAAQ
jgi:hypothetical protein